MRCFISLMHAPEKLEGMSKPARHYRRDNTGASHNFGFKLSGYSDLAMHYFPFSFGFDSFSSVRDMTIFLAFLTVYIHAACVLPARVFTVKRKHCCVHPPQYEAIVIAKTDKLFATPDC